MDLSRFLERSRYFTLALALPAFGTWAHAEGSSVQPSDEPSSLVVMASDAGDAVQAPASIKENELVLRTDDSDIVAATDDSDASAEASLSVVANSQRKPTVSALIIDPAVQQTAARARVTARQPRTASRSGPFSGGPRRPGETAGNQQIQQRTSARLKSVERSPQQSARQVPAAKSQGAATANAAPTRVAAGSASALLVQAYQLSLSASTEAEYSQIVRSCAEAMRQGLEGENRKFALELSAWALNRRGQLRADQGQQETAVSDFRAALEFDPNCWRALHNRGVTLAQTGKFAEAFDDISKVIQLNPQFAKAYSNRATLYVQAGDFDKALADYDSALAIEPGLLQALVGRGRICHMTGRLEEALISLDRAIDEDGENAEVICSRADLLVDLGLYTRALEDYARAIDLNPNFEHAYRNGAWLLATCPDDSIRDVEGAIKGAQSALECGYGERHSALDTLAAALANAGRFDEAVGAIQQAIEVAPPEAVPSYQARQQLYESGQPFRTYPVGDDVQAVEFVEG